MNHYKLLRLKPATLALAIAISGQSMLAKNMDPIEWCSRAGSEPARITCLEEALRNRTGQTPDVIGTPTDKPGISQPRAETSTNKNPSTTPVESKKTFKETLLDKLGRKESRARRNEDTERNERLTAHVSSFKFVGYKKLWIKLDNGQIWQQKKSDRSTLGAKLKRFEEFDVELWQTGFGGYRLYIPDINKTLSVNRLN